MTPDSKRCEEAVRQGEVRQSTAPSGESLEKKKVRFSTEVGAVGACATRTTGRTSMSRAKCSSDSISRWNQTWNRRPPRLRWIVCWQMELGETFPEVMALASATLEQNTFTRHIFSFLSALMIMSHTTLDQGVSARQTIHVSCACVFDFSSTLHFAVFTVSPIFYFIFLIFHFLL